jgi:hypothetical protein
MSPVVTPTRLLRPEDVVEYVSDYIEGSALPFENVLKYNEFHASAYPAVQVMSGEFQKELYGTHTFLLTLRADIYVMHAKLTEDRQTRNYNDLKLATDLVAFLENDLTLGGRIIAGWVVTETPGAMPPRTNKGDAVVSTLLKWQGTQEGRF